MANKPQISVATVPKIPTKSNSIRKESDGITTHYEVKTFYINNSGTLQVPLAGADGIESRIVKTSAKSTKKIVMWEAEKIGGIPDIPPVEQNSNEILEEMIIGTVTPMISIDGTSKIFTLTGKYVYSLKKPTDETKDIQIDRMPIDKKRNPVKITKKNYLK